MAGDMGLHSQVHRDRFQAWGCLLSEDAWGRARGVLRSTSAREVRVPGRASPMAQGRKKCWQEGEQDEGVKGAGVC